MEVTLEATSREKTGSSESRRVRSSGLIPAVMYGLGAEPQSLLINAREFTTALKTEAGSNVILNVNIGKDNVPALAREIQRHAYKDEIVHVDLVRIDLSQTVEADVQVNLMGTHFGKARDKARFTKIWTLANISSAMGQWGIGWWL